MTISLGDISVRYVQLLLKTARDNGIKTHSIEQQFLLSKEKLTSPYSRISIPRFMRLGERLIHLGDCHDLGLKCGANIRLSDLGITGYLAANAQNLHQSLNCIARYEKLSSQNLRGHSNVRQDNNKVIFCFYSISPYNQFNYFVVDLALRATVNFVNELSGQNLEPERIEFEFPAPHYASLYSHYFSAPVYFNQPRNAVVYRKEKLMIAHKNANEITYLELKTQCDHLLSRVSQNDSFVEQVMNEIGPLLTSKAPTMEQVAHNLGMPPWTLRRRLKEEQVRFKGLIDETRQTLAGIYTKDPQYSLEEVSFLLGFANPTAFHRAFKRWFNCTASEYRANKTLTD